MDASLRSTSSSGLEIWPSGEFMANSSDAAGGPCFVGDAVADPLTGMVAAALVIDAVGRGGGVTLDVALREVARSAAHGARLVW